ncbi:MAG: sigma-70 family RNA polymerase sigma factor [Myxococcota bacterium]
MPAVVGENAPAPADTDDSRALQELYASHAEAITRRLAHMTGDPDLARDITQDAFVTAMARLGRFRGDSNISTWLHGIAYNHLRDRRKRKRRELSMWQRLRHRRGEALQPDQAVESKQDLARLQTIVAALDDDKRDAFVLRVIEKLSLEESAQILGARVATVSYRARKAEALVRAAFEKGAES